MLTVSRTEKNFDNIMNREECWKYREQRRKHSTEILRAADVRRSLIETWRPEGSEITSSETQSIVESEDIVQLWKNYYTSLSLIYHHLYLIYCHLCLISSLSLIHYHLLFIICVWFIIVFHFSLLVWFIIIWSLLDLSLSFLKYHCFCLKYHHLLDLSSPAWFIADFNFSSP